MNVDLIFRLILAFLFVFIIGIRRYFEIKPSETTKEGMVQDLDSRTLISIQSLLLTVSNLAIIVFIINPNWMDWSSVLLPNWVRWMGVAIGVAGCILLFWSHRALADNFFGGMKLRQGHQLIVNGPYRWVRHPIYTAFILIGLAWFFLTGNWFIVGLWLAASVLVIITRVKDEEQMMLAQFGESYRIYTGQTGRFLPRLKSIIDSLGAGR